MEINKEQKIVVYVVIAAIVFMFLFPPTYLQGPTGTTISCGYKFIVSANADSGCRVDGVTLLVQWAGILIIGVLAFFVIKGRH